VPLNVTVMDLGLTEAAPALEDVFEEVALPADTAVGVDSLGGRDDVNADFAGVDGALEPLDLTVVRPEEIATTLGGVNHGVEISGDNGNKAALLEGGETDAASADVIDGDVTPSDQALPEMIDERPTNDYCEAVNKYDSQQQQHNLGATDGDQRLATTTTVSETEVEAVVAPNDIDFLVAPSVGQKHEEVINPVNDNDSALGLHMDASVLGENFSAGTTNDLDGLLHEELTLDSSAGMDLTASEPTTTTRTGTEDEMSQSAATDALPAELDTASVPAQKSAFSILDVVPSIGSFVLPAWSKAEWLEYSVYFVFVLSCVMGLIWLCRFAIAKGKAVEIKLG